MRNAKPKVKNLGTANLANLANKNRIEHPSGSLVLRIRSIRQIRGA